MKRPQDNREIGEVIKSAKTAFKVKWRCPKCGATTLKGFLCECEESDIAKDHGEKFTDVCNNASCHHCGWFGVFPEKPKGLRAWEKKALDEGWAPPASRARELGL